MHIQNKVDESDPTSLSAPIKSNQRSLSTRVGRSYRIPSSLRASKHDEINPDLNSLHHARSTPNLPSNKSKVSPTGSQQHVAGSEFRRLKHSQSFALMQNIRHKVRY